MKKTRVMAVHKKRLEAVLKNLGLWDTLVAGQLKCTICGERISLENIGLIIPSNNEISICCSRAECLFRFRGFGEKLE